jgi:hypothetical protein
LPIVSIEANEDYVGSFWLAMQSMLHEWSTKKAKYNNAA